MNLPLRSFPLMCVNPRKLNVSGLPFPLMARFSAAKRQLHQTGFLPGEPWSELPQSALHGYTEAPGIVSFVEPDDDVVGVSDHYHIACWHSDVATDAPTDRRRSGGICLPAAVDDRTLWGAFLRCSPLTLLRRPGCEAAYV